MRVLGVNANGILIGGADGVFLSGGELLTRRGHAVAWLVGGSCDIAKQLQQPCFSLGQTEATGVRRRKQQLIGMYYEHRAIDLAEHAIRTFAPDVVHAHTVHGSLSPSVLLPFKRAGIPVIQTLHDYRLLCPARAFLSHERVCESCKGGKYYHCLLKRCSHGSVAMSAGLALTNYINDFAYRYDGLIRTYVSPSHFLRNKMVEFGYDPQKITVLQNAYFHQVPEHGARDKARRVLFVGRLSYEKGLDTLIRAAKGLDAEVVLVGDGPERARLVALAQDLQLDNVRFAGFLPPQAVAEQFSEASLAVLPSRWYENGPLVILEAHANGTPVIGADIGAIPEFIEDGKTGYLFEVNNPDSLRQVVQRALSDPAGLRRMGDYVRRLVSERYAPEIYVQKLEEILESVL